MILPSNPTILDLWDDMLEEKVAGGSILSDDNSCGVSKSEKRIARIMERVEWAVLALNASETSA